MTLSSVQFSKISHQFTQIEKTQSVSAERLTTGLRINSAADDAAGLAVSNGMESVIRASALVQDFMDLGQEMLEATDGVLSNLESAVQKMRQLTLQAGSTSLSEADRALIQQEIEALAQHFDHSAMGFDFNNQPLLSQASTLTMPAGPKVGDQLAITFESFSKEWVGSHHFKVDASGAIAAQTLTIQSDYHAPVQIVIPAGQSIAQVVALINKAADSVSFEARANDVESFQRSFASSFTSGLSEGELSFSVANPFFETQQTVPAFDASSASSAAFAAGLQAFADSVVSNAPPELQMTRTFNPPSAIGSYPSASINATVPAQTVTLTGYLGQGMVSIPAITKDALDLQPALTALSALAASTGVSATGTSHFASLTTTGEIVDFEVTTRDGTFPISQTFNQIPDAVGFLGNNANWTSLKDQLEAIAGISVSLQTRAVQTGVAPNVITHGFEFSGLSMSFSPLSGVWFENTTQSVGESWALSGTPMGVAGKTYLSKPGVTFYDVSGQTPGAYRVDTTDATARSVVSFTSPRIRTSGLAFEGIEAPFVLQGNGSILNGTRSALSAGVTQTGISFDAWHPYEIQTSDVSGSLFKATLNTSHLKALAEIDLTDLSEWDDALAVVDKTLERVNYQRLQNGIQSQKMEVIGRVMSEQSHELKRAQSNIQDADYALEAATLAKTQILKSASSSMMSYEIERIKKTINYLLSDVN